jgi:hypothetical protein
MDYTLSSFTPLRMGFDIASMEFCLSTGEEDRRIDQASIRPNPIDDHAIVQFREPLAQNSRIELRDVYGRVLRSWHSDGTHELRLERSGLSSGMYVLSVIHGSGLVFTTQLIFR